MEKKLPENMTMINEDDLSNVSGGTQCTDDAVTPLSVGIQLTLPVLNSFNMTPISSEEFAQMEQTEKDLGYPRYDASSSPKARGI